MIGSRPRRNKPAFASVPHRRLVAIALLAGCASLAPRRPGAPSDDRATRPGRPAARANVLSHLTLRRTEDLLAPLLDALESGRSLHLVLEIVSPNAIVRRLEIWARNAEQVALEVRDARGGRLIEKLVAIDGRAWRHVRIPPTWTSRPLEETARETGSRRASASCSPRIRGLA